MACFKIIPLPKLETYEIKILNHQIPSVLSVLKDNVEKPVHYFTDHCKSLNIYVKISDF